jgi:hypothetical protein
MKNTDLENAKFLLMCHNPNNSSYSTELIWKRTKSSITTINVGSFLEVTYKIRTTKNGEVTFPNIPKVSIVEYHHLYDIKEQIGKHRRALTAAINEKRYALEKVLAEAKEFDEFYTKLEEKLPHDFKR